MENQIDLYRARVKMILYRDYAGNTSDWIEAALCAADLEVFRCAGYTEEAAAQKIFEENLKFLKPD